MTTDQVQEVIPDDHMTFDDLNSGHQSREVTPDDLNSEMSSGQSSSSEDESDIARNSDHQSREVTLGPDDLNSEMSWGQSSSSEDESDMNSSHQSSEVIIDDLAPDDLNSEISSGQSSSSEDESDMNSSHQSSEVIIDDLAPDDLNSEMSSGQSSSSEDESDMNSSHQSREVIPDDSNSEISSGQSSSSEDESDIARNSTPNDLAPDDLNSKMSSGQSSSSKDESNINVEDSDSDCTSQDSDYTPRTAEDGEEERGEESSSDCDIDSDWRPPKHFIRSRQSDRHSDSSEEYPFCEDCFGGSCPTHGPLEPLESSGQDQASLAHTPLSVPSPFTVKPSSNSDTGLGVYATQFIPKRVHLGQYEGKRVDKQGLKELKGSAFKLKIWHKGEVVGGVDASDPAQSNWLKYVNYARSEKERNLIAFQYQEDIYFCTSKNISPGAEVLVQFSSQSTTKAQESFNDASCLRCGCLFAKKYTLRRHLKNTQCAAKPQTPTCGKCHQQFSEVAALRQHIEEHIEREGLGASNQCEFCRDSFDGRIGLHQHLKVHTRVLLLKCVHCERCFRHKRNLEKHVQTRHSSKLYKCEICGKCYHHRMHLSRHFKSHPNCDYVTSQCLEKSKPYKCKWCGKCFDQNGELQAHLETHSDDRPYKCEHCGKCFRDEHVLRRHVGVHSSEKSFECDVCGKCYGRKDHLTRHFRLKHPESKP